MENFMKKVTMIISFFLLLTTNYIVVYAGDLNQYESEVVDAAKGIFEVDGVTYQVEQSYINELIRYLKEDNVDITAEQRDEAITIMHTNIEKGVMEGYLIPVTKQDNLEDADGVQPEEQPSISHITEGKDNKEDRTNPISEEKTEEFIHQIINEPDTTTRIDAEKGKVIVTKGADDSLITLNTVIKNTGFNLNITLMMLFLLFLVMAICFFAAFKLELFIHEEEKYKYEK